MGFEFGTLHRLAVRIGILLRYEYQKLDSRKIGVIQCQYVLGHSNLQHIVQAYSIVYVIAQFVVWENPNPNNKCVTQLGTPINVTSIDVPLILVKDKSNTREASWVTLGGLRWEKQEALRVPL
jgi:hypothetical protein